MTIISKILSLILVFAFLPIILSVCFLIILDDGFPIFFKQKRIGQNKNSFWIYKFRTMRNGVPNVATDLIKRGSFTFTKLGPFFRRTSLDELPQLFNIIKGDMSFIGPRPALYNQFDLIKLRESSGIHILKPGITGWAQINGRDTLSIQEKVQMDSYYLKNRSIKLNFKILALTFFKVLRSDDIIE